MTTGKFNKHLKGTATKLSYHGMHNLDGYRQKSVHTAQVPHPNLSHIPSRLNPTGVYPELVDSRLKPPIPFIHHTRH